MSNETNVTEQSVIDAKLDDALTPQLQVEVSPIEADLMGAFIEDAMSEEDALTSALDGGSNE
ncbi:MULTISPECIES: conjugal transfer protein TraD [Shewanella]|jgi:hypothetical protein|uniref:conjugal transfer protein TraD n=1 Tax=Shewanella TaxID=22 RepID=UPI00002785F2|nr:MULTISPECIES: conjugal transfer protein TraD [Shewanella]MCS6116860.1 conjugal transfer protein TraD [Shewanella baltica]QQK62471.1 conjugal transfer protein TraD [Shewanella sp. LC6]TPE56201.1 conjugal transfer protein TraD [Shewanella sp. LC2]UVW66486.1 conjugal transfer protein TraD [Shewanella baltica]BDQ68667.1 hypothetical protein NUITMVS2_44800 [Shewanella xiamenensis]